MPVDDNAFLTLRTAGGPGRVPARELHRVEEPVLVRDLRPRRQAARSTASAAATASSGSTFYRMLPEMGPPETTIWEYPRGDHSWALEFARVRRRHPRTVASRPPACRTRGRARSRRDDLRTFGYRLADACRRRMRHDHHPQSAADHARRRRHRPAVLLPRARRLPHRRRDRQVRLRHGDAAVHAGHLPEVLAARARRADRRRAAPDHPRGDARCSASRRRRSRSRRWPTSRPAPASARRAASRPRCSRRSTRTGGGCCIPASSPSWRAKSRSTGCGEPVGKQDQYIAAFGGVTCFTFQPDGSVEAEPLAMPMDTLFNLEDNLLLFFTGFSRSAGSILADQKTRDRGTTTRDDRQPALRQGARPAQPRRARDGRHRRLRRADARALGAQEARAPAA